MLALSVCEAFNSLLNVSMTRILISQHSLSNAERKEVYSYTRHTVRTQWPALKTVPCTKYALCPLCYSSERQKRQSHFTNKWFCHHKNYNLFKVKYLFHCYENIKIHIIFIYSYFLWEKFFFMSWYWNYCICDLSISLVSYIFILNNFRKYTYHYIQSQAGMLRRLYRRSIRFMLDYELIKIGVLNQIYIYLFMPCICHFLWMFWGIYLTSLKLGCLIWKMKWIKTYSLLFVN